MPIRIDRMEHNGHKESVAWLCDGCWRLPDQEESLTAWLVEHGSALPSGEYRADIGFSVRDDALGGGALFSVSVLRQLVDLNMELWLSEYPPPATNPGDS